jgi:hypothetical protein
MSKRIEIIGAGWYGCYLGWLCKKKGIDYVIYEKSDEIFTGASFYNQNRLHQGYHYPRDFSTRFDSNVGFYKFLDLFQDLTCTLNNNVYAIHKNSILDFKTYVNIFAFEGYKFEILNLNISENFEGAIRVEERFIDPFKSKSFFEDCGLNIEFNSVVKIVSEEYYLNDKKLKSDLIVNATYGQLQSTLSSQNYFTQKYLSILVKRISSECPFDALTVMDGPFYSIYPYVMSDDIYTLTHVKFGIIYGFLTKENIESIYDQIKNDIIKDWPDFEKNFQFFGSFISNKYKPISSTDLRTAKFFKDNNSVVICSGKIDTIFLADELL